MTKVDLFHNLRVKFNELSLREHLIVEETTKELEQENNKLLDVINNQDVKIADLEKKIKEHESVGNEKFWENVWTWKGQAEQLEQATNIIKKFTAWFTDQTESNNWKPIIEQAEQFIKETKNEKNLQKL